MMRLKLSLRVSQRSLLFIEDLSSASFNYIVHQFHQIGLLVRLLILFGEVLDRVVDEVFQVLCRLFIVMQEFHELSGILFAIDVTIRLVEQLESFNEDL